VRFHDILAVVTVGWLVALGSLASDAHGALGPAPLALGAADGFAVMGASTVTSAGVSAITGDLGVSPGTAVTGFGPGTINGTLHAGDATAAQAHADLATAYTDAVGRAPATPVLADLGGVTLSPGVYSAGAALTLAGTLTLDAQGNPAAVFILQAGSTLGTAAGSQVILAGGAQSCNVFWQVGSSATLGASSGLDGTILAATSISMGDGVTIDGRALARDGAVTMINDTVSAAHCTTLMSSTAPTITPFTTKLTGLSKTVTTTVGGWSVTDARLGNAGYSVTVAASAPTVGGSTSAAGTGGSLTLTPGTASAANNNPPSTGPVPTPAQILSPTAATIETAPTGTGHGEWDFPVDAGSADSLAILIPGNADAGSYSSTLTFTTAPPAS
jgi:Ice-binding-like/WxL domain surface cell wall-binding